MSKVPLKATPLTIAEMAQHLETAFRGEMGRDMSRDEGEWLLALLRTENANGSSIIAHNWGNRAALPSEDYWVPSWADEDIPFDDLSPRTQALRKRFEEGDAVPGKFAAYESHDVGARKFVKLFKSRTHNRILQAAANNDARAFWDGIGTKHPVTKKRYCEECHTQAAYRNYKALHDDNVRKAYFSHLKAAPGVQAGEDSSSQFSELLESVGSYREGGIDTVSVGSRGLAVLLLQGALGLERDAKFGPLTKRAVQQFQARATLNPDGVCGPKTWTALASNIQQGNTQQ